MLKNPARTMRDVSTLVVAFLLAPTAKSSAQEPQQLPQRIPPVEVIATKVPERPHDVAASIEVFSGDEHIHAAAIEGDGRNRIDGLAAGAGLVFSHGNDSIALPIENGVCVTEILAAGELTR